jgi:hypothetical protein
MRTRRGSRSGIVRVYDSRQKRILQSGMMDVLDMIS